MAYPYDEEDKKSALIQGLLGAGLAALGARKGSEYNAFAQAGLLGLGGYNTSLRDATNAREAQALRKMREEQYAMQKAQWEQAQAEKLKMQQAAAGAFVGGSPEMGPPTPQGEMQPAVAPQFSPQAYIASLQRQGLPQQAIAAADKYQPERKEVKETRTLMQNGKRVTVNIYKDGTTSVVPFDPDKEKLHFGSTGGRALVGADPYSGDVVSPGVPATPSPDALLTDRRLREQNDIARGNAAGSAADSLRKEFNALPPVQAFGKVLPALQSAREAVGQDNAAADLNLIYAAAKVFDPESVVRESETTMVASAGSPAQRFIGQFNYVAGGGRLTPETRKQLMQQIESRARGYETSYNAARKTYSTLAAKRGVDAADVFIEPTTSSVGGPEYKDPRASGGAIKPATASTTLPDPKSLPDGAIVTDTQTGRKLKVRNGRYVSP